ncbi:MAG TPA: oxidoreductase, partial [Rikenellaceae bacterium]|nr:oxidoreductase [Rikenellaceae bacterium]
MGAAGYIAPRHLKAIKETGNNLVAAVDPFDSVGIMDSYFPECSFFREFELFDRHLSKLKSDGTGADYLSVCSPDYLHDAHIRYGLKIGTNVISEKPLVLNPWNLDALEKAEKESGKRVFTILQMRYHQSIIDLKNMVENGPADKIYNMDLTYITSRGNWFFTSWKGDVRKSGGIATNIGIHFYDMLNWVFGDVQKSVVHVKSHDRVAGYIEFKRARVRYFLSINAATLPEEISSKGQRIYRSFNLDGQEIEFTDGFSDLHTESYKKILQGEGFGITEARKSIQIVSDIRNSTPVGLKGDYHP